MNTSYFGLNGHHPQGISVARWAPKTFKGQGFSQLAPSKGLFDDKGISHKGYEARYRDETLSVLDARETYDRLGDAAVLLCWETPYQFCHRQIIAAWFLEELNIPVKELIIAYNQATLAPKKALTLEDFL